MGISLSGNKSDQKTSVDQEIFDPAAYHDMYAWAQNLFRGMMPQAQHGFALYPEMQNKMRDTYNLGLTGSRDMLGGGSVGDTSDIRSSLVDSLNNSLNSPSKMGMMYEDILGGPGNTYADPLIDSMRTAGDERRRMMQSGNALNASAMGQGGSNRHAMENAMTNRMVDQDLNLAENAIREGNYGRDMDWKMQIARQADQNVGASQDRMMSLLGQRDQNVGVGMGYQPTMQNLGMGMMAPWMQATMFPWQLMGQYANTLGDPTVLTDSYSKGGSKGGGFGIG